MTADVRAITVREPWASCIASGVKLIENRGAGTNYRGKLLIHTSQQTDNTAVHDGRVRAALWPGVTDVVQLYSALNGLDGGVVIAVAELVDVHTAEDIPTLTGPPGTCCEPWGERVHNGRYAKHLVLANVRRLRHPVPARGALGLWTPPADIAGQVRQELAEAAPW
ncbi:MULTISPECIES: hypothetical protein [unclassified Micromonospora]|uniref:hypothetical protein n=1 Tax=unclassified Micromonospora TaxID=2617518 RepID=UPI00331E207F